MRQQDEGELGATSIGVLAAIWRAGPSTLGELAAGQRVAPPTITKVVEKLEALALVQRSLDRDDRRVTRISLTAAGMTYVDRTRERRTAWLAARLAELSPEQLAGIDEMIELLETLAIEHPEPRR
jgi:DNA-binding MarR family transcriptional regulator